MNKMPLDTLVGAAQPDVKDTLRLLVQDVHLGTLTKSEGGDSSVNRYLVLASESPVFVVDLHTTIDNTVSIFTDMRAFITDKRSIRRMGYRDYALRDLHSQILSYYASGKHTDLFLTDLAFSGKVFIEAIVMRLIHIYRLDGEQQLIARLILAQWYGQSLRNSDEYTETQYLRDVRIYAGIDTSKLSPRLLDIARVPPMYTLEALTVALRDKIASSKISNMVLTTFLVLMKSLVFIFRGDVVIPLALEFPPMFVALTYMALTDKSMRRSYLFTAASSAQRQAKKEAEVFLVAMTKLKIDPSLAQE